VKSRAFGFLMLAMFSVGLEAQLAQKTGSLSFEVASVKPSVSGFNGVRGGCHGIDSKYSPNEMASAPALGRCRITDGCLSHMIYIAYELRNIGLLQNAPDWVGRGCERFTIEAMAEDAANMTEQQLLGMLQSLLVERFKLRFHRESRDVPGVALTLAKSGPKLREAKGAEVVSSFGASFKPVPGQPITLTARKYSMQMLADLLSQIGQAGPVIDKTGMHGVYDLQLSWDEAAGPALVTALQEQLGLRFEPRKVPVSFFIFESAERPAAN
jgi:uncharacterized protein (TIGR03435 family)